MTAPIYYVWNESDNRYVGAIPAQIDPLETEMAGHDVYCGMPNNATEIPPLEPKEGFWIVWNGEGWEYEEENPTPPQPEPTIEEKKELVRETRNAYLEYWDFSQLRDAPFTEEEKKLLAEYRQYLRDYTEQENWWEQNPLSYEEWEGQRQ